MNQINNASEKMPDLTVIQANNIAEYSRLFNDFNLIPTTKINRTFMEVSGYPHYENVCTNILAFYFDPEAEHGLRDLLLRAFFKILGVEDAPFSGKISITREMATAAGNRLDLVIEGDNFIIGIENKIYHHLNNDLCDYSKTLDTRGAMNKCDSIYKVILGLTPIKDEAKLTNGFKSYTYVQLWQSVKEIIGMYLAEASPKWLTYLIDFMETTINLSGKNMELNQTDQFFIEHNGVIERLVKDREAFKSRLTQIICELAVLMGETTAGKSLETLPYKYSTDRLVLDFKKIDSTIEISFDLFLLPSGWELRLFGRGKPSHNYLIKLIEQTELKNKLSGATTMDNGTRFCVQKWEVKTDLIEIEQALCSWIDDISKAIESTAM
jgi:hypothetical protein